MKTENDKRIDDAREVEYQRRYYSETAHTYDNMHINEEGHLVALSFMFSCLEHYRIKSILDIGSGTGRVPNYVMNRRPDLKVIGIEPVKELREQGYEHGIPKNVLIDGDATCLQFDDGEFDLVCEFGVLHHIKNHEKAVLEMLRVAKTAVFISDANCFGQGSAAIRTIKQLLNTFGLWKAADFIKTKGKGYSLDKTDGLSYSYSVLTSYRQIKDHCERIHFLNTKDGSFNIYRTASHIAMLAIKHAVQ